MLWGGLLLLICIVYFIRDTLSSKDTTQPKRGIVYVNESAADNNDKPAAEESVNSDIERLTFISFLPDTKSLRVSCGSLEKTSTSRVSIVIPKGDDCNIIATDSTGASSTVEVKKPNGGIYLCFSEGKLACVIGEEPTLTVEPSVRKETPPRSKSKPKKEIIAAGYITISSDEDAHVFINGIKIRKVPLFKHKLTEGSHRVHLGSVNGKIKTFTIEVEAQKNYTYKWSFAEEQWLIKQVKDL